MLSNRYKRFIALAAAILGAQVLVVAPVTASEMQAGDGGEQPGVRVTGEKLPAPYLNTNIMWVWPERRLGFQAESVQSLGKWTTRVTSWDLDRLTQVNSLELPGYQLAQDHENTGGQVVIRGRTGTLDPDHGRLFLGYTTNLNPFDVTNPSSSICASTALGDPCNSGLLAIDAESLTLLGSIPFQQFRVEGGALSPNLRTITYSPPRGPDDKGKLHALVYDFTQPVPQYGNLAYVVQLDPAELKQDWAVRVDACRDRASGTLFSSTTEWASYVPGYRPNLVTLMRSTNLEDPAMWVGCHASGLAGTVVRVPLRADGSPHEGVAGTPVSVVPPENPADPRAENNAGTLAESARRTVNTSGTQETFPGPRLATEMISDPVSERILMRVIDGEPSKSEVWWVFDGRTRTYMGTIGIGRYREPNSIYGFDAEAGRLYVLAPKLTDAPGGLYIVDIRRNPIPQALWFPEMAEVFNGTLENNVLIAALSRPGSPTRLFIRTGHSNRNPQTLKSNWIVVEEAVPMSIDNPADEYAGRTLDLDETPGVTASAFDGAARGYGVRALFVGGVDKLARVGPLDWQTLLGVVERNQSVGQNVIQGPINNPCRRSNREIILGSVGPDQPSVLDASGTRGSADPVVVDSSLHSDLATPISRCAPKDWDTLWETTKIIGSPPEEPGAESPLGTTKIQCTSGDSNPSSSYGDPVTGSVSAGVSCDDAESSGHSYVRSAHVADVGIAESLTSFRIYRDPGRGIVAQVGSVVRGLSFNGAFRIDALRGTAESWANGRAQSISEAERDPGYDPNCDLERTAGTCFRRSVFGLWTPGYQCGPCGDEKAAADAMTRALGTNAKVAFRDPDPKLRRGTANGFLAAISKPDVERFSDLVLNNDLLQTVVPTLEVIRYAPASAPTLDASGYTEGGRQIYQFAGVEVSSSYGIACLLVYDPATNTCANSKEEPGSIAVSLTDADGKALADGAFEVRQDIDTDGVVGLKDTLLPNGACVTTDDGTGTCTFENLQPGAYLVSQVAAPPQYSKVSEPYVVDLASGEARTVTFVNTSNVSTVHVQAADETGSPTAGAQFAVYPDPDSDGKVAADAEPTATCTTDASGSCSMQVPAGSYVLVQTSAPSGLEPIEPVAFTFASGGQTAAVGIVNYPAGTPAVEPAASPIEYSAPPPAVITETIADGYKPTDTTVVAEPRASLPEAVGGTIVRVVAAPGDALRLLSRDPKQAVAWTASLMLFALALMAIRRRQHALELMMD